MHRPSLQSSSLAYGLSRAVAAAMAAVALSTCASAAEQVHWHASYSASLAGLPIAAADLIGAIDGQSYRLSGTGRLSGLARLLGSGQGSAESRGAIRDGKILPAQFRYSETYGRRPLSIEMEMRSGTVTKASVVPPVDPSPDRVPVTDAERRGIVDPISALLIQTSSGEPTLSPSVCARTIRIFDGRQRFDVELSFAGMSQVQAAQGYAGPVVVCRAAYRPIAGHRATKKEVHYVAANRTMEIWFAPIGGTRLLAPYRFSIGTAFGTGVIEASRFEARPVTRRAAAE